MSRRILTRTSQASALAAATALLLAACGSSSPQASQPTAAKSTAANSTAAFCSAARRVGNDQKTFGQYAEKEPASVIATVLSVAKDAEIGLGEMQRLAPASLTADVKAYVSDEKPYIDEIVANRGQLKQEADKMKKTESGMKSGMGNNPKLQRALSGIGNKCGIPGSVLMPMPASMGKG
jgi:hypothetical protein